MGALRLIALFVGTPAFVAGSPPATSTIDPSPPIVTSGLRGPDDVATAPGELRRVYVVEQRGTIRIAAGGRRTLPVPFLDIRPLVKTSLLEGLFSVAFHPNYRSDPRFYVDYVGNDGRLNVVEYRSRSGRALPGSARPVLSLDVGEQHYGGDLLFGPDGMLYVSVGDGNVGARAQDPVDPRGKILRLDVDTPDAEPEIVALGLRNPWRFSFDRRTGDPFIGDVGADIWEEIDYLSHNVSTTPNYGWNLYEGRHRTGAPGTPAEATTFPIVNYRNPKKGCAAVVGGFVYRGLRTPGMRGRYVYGDLCGSVWSLRVVNGQAVDRRRERFVVPGGLASFGEGARGELYAVSLGKGAVYRLMR